MADEITNTEVKDDQGQAPGTDATNATDGNANADTPTDKVEGANESELPEWAKKELAKARGEAAKYRTSLRDAEAKLEGAKTPEEFEAAKSELTKSIRNLERDLVATKHGLPEALAKRLEGSTLEELEADAKGLKALLAPVDSGEPAHHAGASGGLSPASDDAMSMTPAQLAEKYGRRNRIL